MPNDDFSSCFISKVVGIKTLMYVSNGMKIEPKIKILCYFYEIKISQNIIKIEVAIRDTEHE